MGCKEERNTVLRVKGNLENSRELFLKKLNTVPALTLSLEILGLQVPVRKC